VREKNAGEGQWDIGGKFSGMEVIAAVFGATETARTRLPRQ
jgi:hypothetical protein